MNGRHRQYRNQMTAKPCKAFGRSFFYSDTTGLHFFIIVLIIVEVVQRVVYALSDYLIK